MLALAEAIIRIRFKIDRSCASSQVQSRKQLFVSSAENLLRTSLLACGQLWMYDYDNYDNDVVWR